MRFKSFLVFLSFSIFAVGIYCPCFHTGIILLFWHSVAILLSQ